MQTCYSNNVFRKIKIFEYLETGRYEDNWPRLVWKIFRRKIPKFSKIFGRSFSSEFGIIDRKSVISENQRAFRPTVFFSNFEFPKIRCFRESFSNHIKQTKLLTMRVICDLLNLPVNRSTPTTPSPWSNISPILLKLFLIFIKVCVLTVPYTSISHRERLRFLSKIPI